MIIQATNVYVVGVIARGLLFNNILRYALRIAMSEQNRDLGRRAYLRGMK
jgi:hypothetical protein